MKTIIRLNSLESVKFMRLYHLPPPPTPIPPRKKMQNQSPDIFFLGAICTQLKDRDPCKPWKCRFRRGLEEVNRFLGRFKLKDALKLKKCEFKAQAKSYH